MNLSPARLWRLLPRVDSPSSIPGAAAARRETLIASASREYPRTLTWAACVLLVMTIATFFAEQTHDNPGHAFITHVNDVLVAAVLFASAWLLRADRLPVRLRSWFFLVPGLALIWSLLWQVTIEGTALNYTYAMFVLIGFGATSLAAGPYFVGAALSIAAATLVAVAGPVGQASDWILVALTAAGIGAILLAIRLGSIFALADATTLAKGLATQDQLTGVLNRHGLLEHVPDLWATAARYNEGVFVAFIDIRGLKIANDRFGHDYGDSLILAAAEKARKSLRGGDLLSRWGGDEFLVVGIGDQSDAAAFAAALESSASADVLASEMGGLSIGIAAGNPARETMADLVSRADEDMYRQRVAEAAPGDD